MSMQGFYARIAGRGAPAVRLAAQSLLVLGLLAALPAAAGARPQRLGPHRPVSPRAVPEIRLDTDAAGSFDSVDVRIASSDDHVYAVWEDDRNISTDIYFNRAFTSGDTLPSDVRIDHDFGGAGYSRAPAIAAAGNKVYVVWQDERSGTSKPDIFFNRSLDGGSTWLASDVRLDTPTVPGGSHSREPEIAAEGDVIHVVWHDNRNGWEDIYYNRSLDAGATWLPASVRLDLGSAAGTSGSYSPKVAMSGSSVYVVWNDFRSGDHDVYLNYSANSGTTWQASDIRIDTGTAAGSSHSLYPRLAVSGTEVHVVWDDMRNGQRDIYYNRSLNGGATWLGSAVRLDDGSAAGAARSLKPAIAVSGSTVYVAWQDERSGKADLYFDCSLDSGTTWLPAEIRLDSGDAPGASASLGAEIAASGASVWVTWWDHRSGGGDVFAQRSLDSGTTWLPSEIRLDRIGAPGSGDSYGPQISVSGKYVHVGWVDCRDGARDVRYAPMPGP